MKQAMLTAKQIAAPVPVSIDVKALPQPHSTAPIAPAMTAPTSKTSAPVAMSSANGSSSFGMGGSYPAPQSLKPTVGRRSLRDGQCDAVEDVVFADDEFVDARPGTEFARQLPHDEGAASDHVDAALVHRAEHRALLAGHGK